MNNYYTVLPAQVRYDKELPPNAKLIYSELVSLCQKDGFCWASNGYFARLYGIEKNSVSRLITALRKRGYIFFKGSNKNVDGVNNLEETLRQICITPLNNNVDPNNKGNIKTIYKANKKKKSNENNIASYDLDDYERYINSKD